MNAVVFVRIAMINYQSLKGKGHSYIAWAVNMGGGIVQDPDCECLKNKGEK